MGPLTAVAVEALGSGMAHFKKERDPALKERIAGLKVLRDQAKFDADRAQALLTNHGRSALPCWPEAQDMAICLMPTETKRRRAKPLETGMWKSPS